MSLSTSRPPFRLHALLGMVSALVCLLLAAYVVARTFFPSDDSLLSAAQAAEASSDFTHAAASLDRLLQRQPQRTEVLRWRARVAEKLQDWKIAAETYRPAAGS